MNFLSDSSPNSPSGHTGKQTLSACLNTKQYQIEVQEIFVPEQIAQIANTPGSFFPSISVEKELVYSHRRMQKFFSGSRKRTLFYLVPKSGEFSQ